MPPRKLGGGWLKPGAPLAVPQPRPQSKPPLFNCIVNSKHDIFHIYATFMLTGSFYSTNMKHYLSDKATESYKDCCRETYFVFFIWTSSIL